MIDFFRRAFTGIPLPIWQLSAMQLINRIGMMVIPFMTLYLTQRRGLSIDEAGFVMMFFGCGAVVGSLLGGRLTDSVGYQKTMVGSLVLNGLGFFVLKEMEGFWAISAAIFCLAVVSEAFRPAASVAITGFSSAADRTRSIALYRLAINLGWACASAIGGLLARIDYGLLFWADGATSLIAAGYLIWFFEKNKRLEARLAAQIGPEKTASKPAEPLRSPWSDGLYLAFLALVFVDATIFLQQVWTVPPFFKERFGFDEFTVGWVMGINGLVVFLFEMPLIFGLEGRRGQFWFVRLGNLLYMASFGALISGLSSLSSAIACVVFVSFGETFVMPFQMSFATKRASARGQQGRYMALYTAAWSTANVVSPLIGTQIVHRIGWEQLWLWTIAASAACFGGFYVLDKKTSLSSS